MKKLLFCSVLLFSLLTQNIGDVPEIKEEVGELLINERNEAIVLSENFEIKGSFFSEEKIKEEPLVDEKVDLLSRIIYAEARGEPFGGKLAVGVVVMNRVNSSDFPNTIKEVIFQSGQFCAAGNGNFHSSPCEESKEAAEKVLSGAENMGGALYFVNRNKSDPSWINQLQFIERIGDHWFYGPYEK